MANVADEKVVKLKICPICFLERTSVKPMTPSNYAHTNNSILSGDQHKIENTMTSKLAANSKDTKKTERSYKV